MRCAGCHRPITDPTSIERGYGPSCWKALHPDGKLNRDGFAQWIFENYTIDNNAMGRELIENVLEYAEGMEGGEQRKFLARMIPQVPEVILRCVSY